MKRFQHKFSDMDEILKFVKKTESCDCPIDVVYGSVIVDGKSVMGIASLGLNKEVDIVFHTDEDSKIQGLSA